MLNYTALFHEHDVIRVFQCRVDIVGDDDGGETVDTGECSQSQQSYFQWVQEFYSIKIQ